MTLEIIAPIVLVVLAAVIVLYTQLIVPRGARRRITLSLTRRGWMKIPSNRDYAWTDIMLLAIEDQQGALQVREYDHPIGPFTVHRTRTEKRSGIALELYKDGGARHQRYAAVGVRKKTVDYSRRGRLSLLVDADKRSYIYRELWIGEVRRIPVDKPEKVHNATDEIFGSAGRKMALKKGVHTDSIPFLALPSETNPARSVREVLLKTSLAQSLMASVYLGPGGWVLIVPLSRVGRRMEDILALIDEISTAIG